MEYRRSKAEEHSLHLIPISSHKTEGFRVAPEDLEEIATYAKKRDLPLLLYEDLNPEKEKVQPLEPTRYAFLFVQGSHTSFYTKVSSRREKS